MGDLEKFFEAIGKARLADISLIKIENVEKLVIGKEEHVLENNSLNFGKVTLAVKRDKNGRVRFLLPDGTEIFRATDDKKENVKQLDKQKRVFTRSDISTSQLPYLSVDEQHETIIKIMRPYLENYRQNLDLGCLLVTSAIIQMEDELADKRTLKEYYNNLGKYKKIGRMIYNLFRSKILQKEIIPHLQKIIKMYDSHEEIKQNFLIYWHGILEIGYPTAYFVKENETRDSFNAELKWRFGRDPKLVYVYSRTSPRNKRVRRWVERLYKRGQITYTVSKPYVLGYSQAIKLTLKKRR